MFFLVAKIFWWFANPGNFLLVLVLLATALLGAGRWRLARWPLFLSAAVMLAVTVLPVGSWVLEPLEDRFPQPSPMPRQVDGVIVLGGAIDPTLSKQRGQPALAASSERLLAMADLARRFPMAKLVYTGGNGFVFGDDSAREADVARDVFEQMGIPEDRILLERDSRNTIENARFSKALVGPAPGETWLLVTSAYHMPRAVGIFRKVGWTVVPYPVDYSVPPGGGSAPGAFLDGLGAVSWGLREWFGLVYYYAAGQSSALFPAP